MDRRDFAAELDGLPRRRDQLLPALHRLHELQHWLPEPAIEAVSDLTSVPLSELYGVISSYSEFRLSPPPDRLIEVCTGLACKLAGAERLVVDSNDAGVAVEQVACRFLCGVAPVAIVAGRYHGRVNADTLTVMIAQTAESVR